MKKLFLLIAIISLTVILSAIVTKAEDTFVTIQVKSPQTSLTTIVASEEKKLQTANEQIGKIKDENDFLSLENKRTRETIEKMSWLFVFFTAVFVFGTVFSVISSLRSESAAEKRAQLIHSLYIKGESAAQDRAAAVHTTFLDDSVKTLTLVNATLTLAKEASERASSALYDRFNSMLDILEDKAKKLIVSSEAYKDDKVLSTNSKVVSEIKMLGRKIEGLEFILPVSDRPIELKPYCLFIRGAESYLNEYYDEALEYLERSTETEIKELKSLACYWMGYINNNLAKFKPAANLFEDALNTCDNNNRKFELTRMKIETSFFGKGDGDTCIGYLIKLISNVDSEIEKNLTDKELKKRKVKILTTLGNIYLQTGNEKKEESVKKEYYTKSKNIFSEALAIEPDDMYAMFGFVDSLFKINDDGKQENAITISRKVKAKAEREFVSREEKRTKVLARMTQLICSIWENNQDDIKDYYHFVIDTLGNVNQNLTIYSQVQKRNVLIGEFREDLKKLLEDNKIQL